MQVSIGDVPPTAPDACPRRGGASPNLLYHNLQVCWQLRFLCY